MNEVPHRAMSARFHHTSDMLDGSAETTNSPRDRPAIPSYCFSTIKTRSETHPIVLGVEKYGLPKLVSGQGTNEWTSYVSEDGEEIVYRYCLDSPDTSEGDNSPWIGRWDARRCIYLQQEQWNETSVLLL